MLYILTMCNCATCANLCILTYNVYHWKLCWLECCYKYLCTYLVNSEGISLYCHLYRVRDQQCDILRGWCCQQCNVCNMVSCFSSAAATVAPCRLHSFLASQWQLIPAISVFPMRFNYICTQIHFNHHCKLLLITQVRIHTHNIFLSYSLQHLCPWCSKSANLPCKLNIVSCSALANCAPVYLVSTLPCALYIQLPHSLLYLMRYLSLSVVMHSRLRIGSYLHCLAP